MNHKPCEGCTDSPSPDRGIKCHTHFVCSRYIEWQVERMYDEREADPQETRKVRVTNTETLSSAERNR